MNFFFTSGTELWVNQNDYNANNCNWINDEDFIGIQHWHIMYTIVVLILQMHNELKRGEKIHFGR